MDHQTTTGDQDVPSAVGSALDTSADATAHRSRKTLLRDPIRLERAIGIVLWLAFVAVLFHFGR